jgi:phosphoglucomutase
MDYKKTFEEWKKLDLDAETAAELLNMEHDDAEIKSRFSSELKFGTAGMRGRLGAGTNRMNAYTVGRATQGLSDYVLENGGQQKGMAVAYDTRKNSALFAEVTALVFAANGIKTYLFETATSVPELSFAIRNLGAFGGVAITASHNPKDYNGYKVYAPWGGQLLNEASNRIMCCIDGVCGSAEVKSMQKDEALGKGLLVMLSRDMDTEYYRRLVGLAKRKENIEAYGKDIKLVYTPLYGTGLRTFKGVMEKLPYDYTLVEEQCAPDPEFPGMKAPNPEDTAAMEKAIKLARDMNADIACGTDPDADRMGAAIQNESGEFLMLSGNQIGCLIAEYLLRQRKQSGELSNDDYIVKSFVSTSMAESIARGMGAQCVTVPTGFKYIGDLKNTRRQGTFVFGFEESYGFLAGDFEADKDGVMALLLLLEVMCECRANGETLYGRLKKLYGQYGWYRESVTSAVMEGEGGMKSIEKIMQRLREAPPISMGGQKTVAVTDYLSGIHKDGSEVKHIDFPSENALKFTLENGWVCVRPSGTEPKIKLYTAVRGATDGEAQQLLDSLEGDARKLLSE